MEPGTRDTVTRAAGWLAGAVAGLALVVAGTAKAMHPATFVADIWSYHLVPESWAYWIAVFLPWLEIVAGAALITHRLHTGARLVAAGMFIVFAVALAISWARGLDVACGCFGGGPPSAAGATNYPWLITRDLLLLACLAVEPWLARRTTKRTQTRP